MDLAIVTGANDKIGYKISQKLVALGFRVYGLAHNFDGCLFAHREFIRVECDLTSTEAIQNAYTTIANEPGNLFAVVHAAQRNTTNRFEATEIDEIEYTLKTGLLGPMVLTRLALPSLIKYHGYVINLVWNGHGPLPTGAAGAATQGGLYCLGKALFTELQDTSVKVCNLYPQKNAAEDTIAAQQNTIDPDLVADAIVHVLQLREHNCVHELVIRPMGTRETPKIPTAIAPLIHGPKEIVLPTRDKFPTEPEPIPTPEAKTPEDAVYFDDEDEEDEDDELDELLEASRQRLLQEKQRQDNRAKSGRNKRGGRNRRHRRPSRDRDGPGDDRSNESDKAEGKSQEPDTRSQHDAQGESHVMRQRRSRGRRNRSRDGSPPAGQSDSPGPVEAPASTESRSASSQPFAPQPRTTAETDAPPNRRGDEPITQQRPAKKKGAKKKTAKKKIAKKVSVAASSDTEPKQKAKKTSKKKVAKKKTVK